MTPTQGIRQLAVMASDAEWERIARAAGSAGMEISRFIVHRTLMPDILSTEVTCRAVREFLVLLRLKEHRLCEAGATESWDEACDAVNPFLERTDILGASSDTDFAAEKVMSQPGRCRRLPSTIRAKWLTLFGTQPESTDSKRDDTTWPLRFKPAVAVEVRS